MTKVYNPTVSCIVKHNINGNVYNIAPGKTTEVADQDVEDLLTLLGFLLVVDEKGKAEQRVIDPNTQQPEMKEVDVEIKKEEAKKMEAKKLKCDETINVKDPATGLKKKIKCTYETTQKKALLGHKLEQHPKKKKGQREEKDNDE